MPLSPLLQRSSSIYSGSGNTFILVDHRAPFLPLSQIPDLCSQYAVDGVVLFEEPMRMRIINADGSEAEMCGNGLRCFVQFLSDLGIKKNLYKIETKAGLLQGWIEGDEIAVTLTQPSAIKRVVVEGYEFDFLNTGVPHAIYFGEIEDFEEFGEKFARHPIFGPACSNINACHVNRDRSLSVRTFERGVWRETGACGTGSSAAALAAHKRFSLPSPIKVHVRSGEILTIGLFPLTLQGKVVKKEEVALYS